MHTLKTIVNFIDGLSERVGSVVSWILLCLVALSCFEVFTRRVLGSPTIWTHEILSYIFCATIMLLMGYTQLYKGHANIDVFLGSMSKRKQVILEVVTFVIFAFPFVLVMLWDGIIFAATSWMMQERTPSAFNAIVYPAKTLIPVGFALLFLQLVADFIKKIVYLVKGEEL
ncbi:MAG: TRAP transporter small permease subunit [Proteobacteria bacterium]|nr:TRAP transporter small permease subunit [Pseudomonadota bacterium]MBU2227628.1 TRAP transporter small permease subunit [Pseudomonadota bacterium]MBU2262119.1 TRAP transporter small permease subunit [Pseudomonadota bacterium]